MFITSSEAAKNVPAARLVMIGDGSQWEACKKLSQSLGIENKVDFRGARSHEEVASVMKEVRALVQHSRATVSGQSEGTPVTILEAGAAAGMADHLTRLARDPNLPARLGGAARNRICSEFSMGKRITYLWQIVKAATIEKRCI